MRLRGSIRVRLWWSDLVREIASAACGDGLEYCFFRLPRCARDQIVDRQFLKIGDVRDHLVQDRRWHRLGEIKSATY